MRLTSCTRVVAPGGPLAWRCSARPWRPLGRYAPAPGREAPRVSAGDALGSGRDIDLRKVAELASLDVTDAEVEAWTPVLAKTLAWFDELDAVDVEGVPPAVRAGAGGADPNDDDDTTAWRADVEVPFADTDLLAAQAPAHDGTFFTVPRVGNLAAEE